jgi:hypothetical protein
MQLGPHRAPQKILSRPEGPHHVDHAPATGAGPRVNCQHRVRKALRLAFVQSRNGQLIPRPLCEASYLRYVSRIVHAITRAIALAARSGQTAYCASASDLGSIPDSRPQPMRKPGLLIMIPPTMNMIPFTMAADVPILAGSTISAAAVHVVNHIRT